jgi:SRSO17 transposase
VLIADETGFIKKGSRSAGVQRQYSGTAGRTENCQVGVFLAYASVYGHALIDRELYLPRSWTEDRGRCQEAGIPDETGFATKPQLAQAMISRALQAGMPFAWFTADEAYGQAKWLQAWLEERGVSYVMAVRRSDTFTMPAGEQRADDLVAAVPARAWQKISAGAGAHGPREYHWARVAVRPGWEPGRAAPAAGPPLPDQPGGISYYACYGPRRSSTADLAWTAGSRWHVEECFQQAKNETGLDHYQVRTWRAWYAHVTLSMLALAWLSAASWPRSSCGSHQTRNMPGPGLAGAENASTRPASATTGDEATP